MRLKWPSRHKENYPFLVTCSFLWVTKIAINFPLGKHFSWPITCEWKTEGKLGFRYHISKEKLKEVILGQIFTLTSFLNNLLNFLRVILENAIGSTDKYKQLLQMGLRRVSDARGGKVSLSNTCWRRLQSHGRVLGVS